MKKCILMYVATMVAGCGRPSAIDHSDLDVDHSQLSPADRVHERVGSFDEWLERATEDPYVMQAVTTGREMVPSVIRDLQDEDLYRRLQAATALGEIGVGQEAVSALRKVLRGFEQPASQVSGLFPRHHDLRAIAARALGDLGEYATEAVGDLTEALNDAEIVVRVYAAEALWRIDQRPETVVPILVDALTTDSTRIRLHAAEVLGRIGSSATDATVPLIETLRDKNKEVRQMAAQSLREFGSEAIPALIHALSDENLNVRGGALQVLAELGPPAVEAVPAVIRALDDKNRDARKQAADTLRRIQPPLSVLLEHLKDVEFSARWNVGRALGRVGPESKPALRATVRMSELEFAHPPRVFSVAFSPDGETLASAGLDKTIILWDLTTRQQRARLAGHAEHVNSIAFSPDGRTLASGSSDKTIIVWNVATGEELVKLQGHASGVDTVAFSPHGDKIASGGDAVIIWDAPTGTKLLKLKTEEGSADYIRTVAFSPDGSVLASGAMDGTAILWEVGSGRQLAKTKIDGPSLIRHGDVNSVVFAPDGTRLALGVGLSWKDWLGDKDGKALVWEPLVETWTRDLATTDEYTDAVTSVAFSPDGTLLASGSRDLTVTVWDYAAGNQLTKTEEHKDWVGSVAFSPDGKTLVSADWAGTIRFWDVIIDRD